jgi:TRAP transporter TAXI family solute receptor
MLSSRTTILVTAAALAAAAAAATSAGAQMYGLGTGKQGFFTYSAGAAIAKVASDNGLALRIQPFGGTSAYVPAVNAKEVDFGLANELETNYAVTGKVMYKGKPQPDIRVVAILTPLYSAFFVRKDSPFKKISDLKGKRIPTDYTSQKVLDTIVQGTLANGGLTYDDIQKVPVPNVAGGADEFAQGKADLFNFALGAGKVAETDAKVGGIRALHIDSSPEAMARLRKWVPVAYATKVEPGPGRAGIGEPTTLFAYDYLVLASTKVTDEAVYKLTKILHDRKDALVAGFRPLAGFMTHRMNKDMEPVQFHPGAIKYYKEIGAWPPKKSGS